MASVTEVLPEKSVSSFVGVAVPKTVPCIQRDAGGSTPLQHTTHSIDESRGGWKAIAIRKCI